MKRWLVFFFGAVGILFGAFISLGGNKDLKGKAPVINKQQTSPATPSPTPTSHQTNTHDTFQLAIATMRQKQYPGSALTIEQTLAPGTNYNRYIASYRSDGFTIYGLLTVPRGQAPQGGWPAIVMDHGYIPPAQYSTENSYAAAASALAASNYIVFKPDYRGNGSSQGQPTQVYVSPDYVTDSLNALASIKKYKDVNPDKIGVWGHSMGGNITLHELVITHDFKAAVIWGGVVGSYTDILNWWDKRVTTGVLTTQNDLQTEALVKQFVATHGRPETNPTFWNTIDPTNFIKDITTPVQIQVGTSDAVVPPQFSENLHNMLQADNKTDAYYTYPGADHNLSPDSIAAMQQTITFFDKYVK